MIKHGAPQNRLYWLITTTVSISVSDNDAFSTIICGGFVCCVVFAFWSSFFLEEGWFEQIRKRVNLFFSTRTNTFAAKSEDLVCIMVRISTLDSILNKSYGLIEMWVEVSVWLFSNYCLQPCWSGKTDETRNGKVPAMAIAPSPCVTGTLEADRAPTRQDWDF